MRGLVTVCVLLLGVACQSDGSDANTALTSDTVRATLAWAVAPGVHPVADSLGEISGVTVDVAENVYATDSQRPG